MRNIFLLIIVFVTFISTTRAQEIGSKYQGGIVVGPGIIIHPTRLSKRTATGGVQNYFDINEANNACRTLRTGGYSDWRVPTIVDLEYINRYAQDNLEWGGFPPPISAAVDYLSSSTKTDNGFFESNTYRYFFYMIGDKTSQKTGFPQKTLKSISGLGYLLPVRYFR
jgi:hypothetical protein